MHGQYLSQDLMTCTSHIHLHDTEIYLQYEQQHIYIVELKTNDVSLDAYSGSKMRLLLPRKQE